MSGELSEDVRRRRREVFIATWLCYAGFYITRKVFSQLKGPIKLELSINDLEVSHLWTTYLVTYMLGQFLAAWLGRRFASRTLLLVGMSVSALGNFAIGSALKLGPSGYVPILILLAIQGFAQATGWPHTIGIVANWTRKAERGTIMSFWATCYQLGSGFAKWSASLFFGLVGLFGAWWISAAMLGVVIVIFYAWGHEKPQSKGLEALEAEPDAVAQAAPEAARAQMGTFLKTIVAMGLIYFGFKFLRYSLDSWSTLIMSEHFKLDPVTAGKYSTAFDWFGFLGVIASGPISDKVFGGKRLPVVFFMSAGCVVSTGLLYALGLGSPVMFATFLALTGFMAMGPDALLSGAGAMDAGTKKQAALAAGIINGLGSIGPIVQEPIIGWLKTYRGLESVFLALVVVALMATIGTAIFWASMRKRNASL